MVLHEEELSWTAAEAACVAEGGHLASIHSDEEQAALDVLISDGAQAWVRACALPAPPLSGSPSAARRLA